MKFNIGDRVRLSNDELIEQLVIRCKNRDLKPDIPYYALTIIQPSWSVDRPDAYRLVDIYGGTWNFMVEDIVPDGLVDELSTI